jgi:levanase/fructan beta-fructosidase
MTFKKLVLCGLSLAYFSGAVAQDINEETAYRPNFHFTPKKNWMNDPNGLFYADGVYHLFFQHWPYGNIWGPMHWGHATSTDLVKWEEQPIALYPDRFGYIFSGSAVYDTKNTSGFGKDGKIPAIALFTYHDPAKEKTGAIDVESQGLAYSLDKGQTWTKYDEGNPVIKNNGVRDFRDPKVTWDWVNNKWIMVLAAKDRAQLYESDNLNDWKYLSDFEDKVSKHGTWECPDFFPIKVKGTNDVKWVLIQSFYPGGANGGSGTQYYVGDFDGKNFTLDKTFAQKLEKEKGIWLDYGRDNYASVTWGGSPDEHYKKYIIGWMINLDYAFEPPTNIWRGTNTVARELELIKDKNGYRFSIAPIAALKKYIAATQTQKRITVNQSAELIKAGKTDLTQAEINLNLKGLKNEKYTFILSNNAGDTLKFGIDNQSKTLFIDRSASSNSTTFKNRTATPSKVSLTEGQKEVGLKILLDKTSIELFYNDGDKVMTEIFFLKSPFTSLTIEGKGKFQVENLVINQFNFK